MNYYHDLFQRFDDCPVSVAFTSRWGHLAVIRRFPSLMEAVEHILDKQKDLQSAVVTAHTPAGPVDFSKEELTTLIGLTETLRSNQD